MNNCNNEEWGFTPVDRTTNSVNYTTSKITEISQSWSSTLVTGVKERKQITNCVSLEFVKFFENKTEKCAKQKNWSVSRKTKNSEITRQMPRVEGKLTKHAALEEGVFEMGRTLQGGKRKKWVRTTHVWGQRGHRDEQGESLGEEVGNLSILHKTCKSV